VNKSCGCPYGCCSCGPCNDNLADLYFDYVRNEFFEVSDGASSYSPVGWVIRGEGASLIYLGKLGDNYYEFLGRITEHNEELAERKARYDV
jgi:hypothetical protein